jgi:hypothetical protein
MNINSQHPTNSNVPSGGADETLRLIAGLPAPKGLEERVHRALGEARALRTAPRQSRLLAWPAAPGASREWVRTAAAAAIAFVIAGGGWGVYRQVQPGQTVNGVLLAPHGANAGGFAGAGAMRTPQTLNGPVVAHPVETHAVGAHTVEAHTVEAHTAQGLTQMNDAKKHGPAAKKTEAQTGALTAKP